MNRPRPSADPNHGRAAHATLAIFLLLATGASAQPVPTLKSASPDVVRRGQTTRVTLTGEHVAADSAQVLFAGAPGLTATIVKPDPAKKSTGLDVDVTAAADAPRGLRELRLVTKNGVTKPLLVSVDDLPAVAEKEPNNAPAEAQPVALPAILTGKIQDALDVDCFKFDARKGQRLVFDVHAFRTGSKLDASLAVLDTAGRRVAHDEDTNGLDPFIAFEVPADGAYTLRLQDLQYRGGPDYAYRIRAGEIPHVTAAFPLGGQRGRAVPVRLTGWNLGAAVTTSVTLDPANPSAIRQVEAPTPAGFTNSFPFAVSDLPEVTEDHATSQSPLAAPLVINGTIGKPNETDTFKVKATVAGPLVVEVAAARLGSRLDALLTVANEAGAPIQRNDDAAGTDARVQFTAEKDKVYQVSVRDLTDKGGDAYGYRISIAPPKSDKPDFEVALVGDPEVRLNRGGTTALRVLVTRRAGLKSDVTVTLAPLPPGVTCKPLIVSATQPSSGVFALTAAPDAAQAFGALDVVATAKEGDQALTRSLASSAALGVSPQVYVSVHEAAPFRVERLGPAAGADPKKVAEQIAALEKQLATPTPALEAAQAKWESAQKPSSWEVLDVAQAKAAGPGVKLAKQPDGSLKAEGANPPTDKFTLTAKAPAGPVRFIKLEAIAEDGRGPGRAENGNFVLSSFAATADGAKVEFASVTATFSQQGFEVANTINPMPAVGWAVSPELLKSHAATFALKAPLTAKPGGSITFVLDHSSPHVQHVLGHFRLLATAADKPEDGAAYPAAVAAALRVARDARTKGQRDAVAAYYRSIAPELAGPREKLAALKDSKSAFPPVLATNAAGTLDVSIARDDKFDADVTLTLEGFTATLDDKTKELAGFAKNFDAPPMILKKGQSRATLSFKPKGGVEKGTRDAVVRAETTVNGAKYVVYSPAFPLTVK